MCAKTIEILSYILKRDGIIDLNNVALLSLKIPVGYYTEEGAKSANSIFNDV